MGRRSTPRKADSEPGERRPYAELDKTFAAHEFLEASRQASGWEPARGELVLVSVRVGVRMRAIYIGTVLWRGYGLWARVVLLGKVRAFPREMVSRHRPEHETPITPELARSIRWGFGERSDHT